MVSGALGSSNLLFNHLFCFNRIRVCNLKNKLKLLVKSQADVRDGQDRSSTKLLEGSGITPQGSKSLFQVIFKCISRKISKNREINKAMLLSSFHRLLVMHTKYIVAFWSKWLLIHSMSNFWAPVMWQELLL